MSKIKIKITVLLSSSALIITLLALFVSTYAASSWAPYTTFQRGDVVAYNGAQYKCIQTHTTLPGWEPSIVPALWEPVQRNESHPSPIQPVKPTDKDQKTPTNKTVVGKPSEVPAQIWTYTINTARSLGRTDDFALLLCAIIQKESWFGAGLNGGSPSSGDGLMQVEPNTRNAYSGSFSAKFGHGYSHGDFQDQVNLGAMIIDEMVKKYGGINQGLLHYNGGPNWYPGCVDSYGRVIQADLYANAVMSTYKSYGGTQQ